MLSSVLLFLNIGGSEMVLIVLVALMLFGGEKLPEIARGLGKGIRDFKDASEDVKREINNQINSYTEKKAEVKEEVTEVKQIEEHHDGVAGTLPAHESYSATDSIEDYPAADVAEAVVADSHSYDTGATAPEMVTPPAPVADETTKTTTTEENYK